MRDGSVVKSTSCSSREPRAESSTHVEANNCEHISRGSGAFLLPLWHQRAHTAQTYFNVKNNSQWKIFFTWDLFLSPTFGLFWGPNPCVELLLLRTQRQVATMKGPVLSTFLEKFFSITLLLFVGKLTELQIIVLCGIKQSHTDKHDTYVESGGEIHKPNGET